MVYFSQTHFVKILLSLGSSYGTCIDAMRHEEDEEDEVGTKHAVIKADPLVYLGQFWGPIV